MGEEADEVLDLGIGLESPGFVLSGDCRLEGAGVEFVEDPKDYGNVWVATFKDPEGNVLQLLQSHH